MLLICSGPQSSLMSVIMISSSEHTLSSIPLISIDQRRSEIWRTFEQIGRVSSFRRGSSCHSAAS